MSLFGVKPRDSGLPSVRKTSDPTFRRSQSQITRNSVINARDNRSIATDPISVSVIDTMGRTSNVIGICIVTSCRSCDAKDVAINGDKREDKDLSPRIINHGMELV